MSEMQPVDQAAVLLLTIGEAEAAKVLKHLEQREIQRIIESMSALGSISAADIEGVVDDFLQSVSDESGLTLGTDKYLRNTLTNCINISKRQLSSRENQILTTIDGNII